MRLLERAFRRFLATLDAVATKAYGYAWNPFYQSGTVAVAMLLVLIGTGLYLLLFYRLGAPSASVGRMAADPWLGAWNRSLHRYASDVFVLAAGVHALRMFAQGRSWGPRTLAWVSGLVLFGAGLVCAWTGFVMAWDSFGERLAREGGRLLDALPVFSEPLSRIFAGDGPVPSAFFFVNMFIHIAVPLAMGAGLWLHVSHLARPALLPPRRLMWGIIGALFAAAVIWPAPLGAPANPFTLAPTTPTDLVAAWWLPLSERLSPGAAWSAVLILSAAALLVPRFARRPRTGALAPSVVDPRLCTGCNQCPQDCPWSAITMVKRDDDRPMLVALVDPARCVSCGICAGSCAPMGIGPEGRTGRDQLGALRSVAFPELAGAGFGAHGDLPPIVAVCCKQAPASHVAALRARGAHVHAVSCVGNLHTSVIELFVRRGAPGVIVCGCPPRDCTSREGPKWLHERVFNDREAELQPRVDRRRVRLATLAPGDRRATLAAFDDFARALAALDRPTRETDVDLDVVCDPVPIGADEEDS
ncbi:MAG: hydrogenase iron-sulfur subunit [Acidobacteriota bacterium]|nr:hydrogenase iron-sulfur subunit [Acidobacteriota bacterium]